MAKNRSDIRTGVRDRLMAWPDFVTTLAEALDTTETGIDLTAVTNLAERMLIEVESETMRVASISGTTATVIRGDRGTSAATHANATAVSFYPSYGWTDVHLNRLISKAIAWLGEGMCWTLVPKTNTWLANYREFGLPSGVVYPTGNIVKRIEMQDDDSIYHEIAGWRHMGDRIIINSILKENKNVRIWIQTKQADITDDSTQLDEDKWAEVLELYATAVALEELMANRPKYLDYSATLNDRASTPDELQRTAYYFRNQATILRDQYSRPGLSGFAPVVRPVSPSINEVQDNA